MDAIYLKKEWGKFEEEHVKVKLGFDEEVGKAEGTLVQIMDWNRF